MLTDDGMIDEDLIESWGEDLGSVNDGIGLLLLHPHCLIGRKERLQWEMINFQNPKQTVNWFASCWSNFIDWYAGDT